MLALANSLPPPVHQPDPAEARESRLESDKYGDSRYTTRSLRPLPGQAAYDRQDQDKPARQATASASCVYLKPLANKVAIYAKF